jgi:hypothetical protein
MTSFGGSGIDLSDAIGYELQAIEYVRATLHDQREAQSGGMSLVLGDLTASGEQMATVNMHAALTGVSTGGTREALNRLRPLAFSAAFKLQDMVVEWILRANGIAGWRFSEKLAGYDRLRIASALAEPSLFSQRPILARAFWELYRFLVPFRGTVVHSGGVSLDQAGTIEVTKGGGNCLRFTAAEQGSYMRATCLISRIMSGQTKTDLFLEGLIEGDLLALEKYHGTKGLLIRGARLEDLTVHIPRSNLIAHHPVSVSVDFASLRRRMEAAYPVEAGGRLYFSVTIVADTDGRQAVWEIPVESVPNGVVTLQEGDPQYDSFMRVTQGNAG